MNTISLVTVGFYIALAYIVITIISSLVRVRGLCRKEIRECIRRGHSIPVEIVHGTYVVVDKHENYHLSLARHTNGKSSDVLINVKVPRRMYGRITSGRVYFFDYDYRNQEICFSDSFGKHTEQSDYCLDELRDGKFPLKAKLLQHENQ